MNKKLKRKVIKYFKVLEIWNNTEKTTGLSAEKGQDLIDAREELMEEVGFDPLEFKKTLTIKGM